MDPLDPPRHQPPPPAPDPRLEAMLELKAQMETLHAQLEYVRLMLKIGVPIR